MRNSRKVLIGLLACAVAFSGISIAFAAQFQTIKGTSSPKKLPKKKFRAVEIHVKTTTGDTEKGVPSPAVRAQIDFDRHFRFTTNGLKRCTANLEGTTTEQANQACKGARVGRGSAKVRIPTPQPPDFFAEFPATVTAFNGRPRNKRPVLLLHSRVDALATTAVLTGVLKNSKRAKRFGKELDVRIPLLAGGAGAITEFETTVKRRFKHKGKTRHYVRARCPKNGYKRIFVGKFSYLDGTDLTARSRQGCRIR